MMVSILGTIPDYGLGYRLGGLSKTWGCGEIVFYELASQIQA